MKEVCEKAEINKSTFYSHYQEISCHLSDKLETEVVESIIGSLNHPENLLKNPERMDEGSCTLAMRQKMLSYVFFFQTAAAVSLWQKPGKNTEGACFFRMSRIAGGPEGECKADLQYLRWVLCLF